MNTPILVKSLALMAMIIVSAVHAADANPPGKMTFQGFLTDASTPPVPLGNTSPVNKEVIFKIYDAGNAGNIKWVESQTVTVDKGHFTVLLGQGSAVDGQPHTNDLSGVFIGTDASERWLGITLDGVEIAPRIQFFAAPYAHLARAANSLTPDATIDVQSGATIAGNITSSGDLTVGGITSSGEIRTEDGRIICQELVVGWPPRANGGEVGVDWGNVTVHGRVGIGTDAPRAPLEIDGFSQVTTTVANYMDSGARNSLGGQTLTHFYSAIFSHVIQALGFYTPSDHRIKQIQDRIGGAEPLDSIRRLRVTDYAFVDQVSLGAETQRGLIAQELEQILPRGVHKTTGFVPDIYAPGMSLEYNEAQQTLLVELEKPHGLRADDLVSLIDETNGKWEAKVQATPTPNRFVIPSQTKLERVFVFGKQVDDFLSVDYDHVFITGISAIQELDRKVQALEASQSRIAELEEKLAAMTALTTKAARVDSLEKKVEELTALVAALVPSDADAAVALVR